MTGSPPRWPMLLGLAGLLPQLLVVAFLLLDDPATRFSALALGFAYPALILSFLGGMWWGLAARAGFDAPVWVWIVAVLPSLVAVATAIPWVVGAEWPTPSLLVLAAAIAASLLVDRRLLALAIAPDWWLRLRVPLSTGLALLTVAAAFL